jgi:hypothetical protein
LEWLPLILSKIQAIRISQRMTSHGFWPFVIFKVIEELALYTQKNIRPTLRAMFYRLVSKKIITNTSSMYTQLSKHTARAREIDDLPIDCFYDECPIVEIDDRYLSPEQTIDYYLNKLAKLPQYYKGLPRWYNQPKYAEIWIEKNAMVPEFKSIMDDAVLEVRLVPHGGYVSLTQLYDSVERIKNIVMMGKKEIHILYFGDFDPSGDQMFDDIKDRLAIIFGFKTKDLISKFEDKEGYVWRFSFDLQRIAINEDQVIRYNLPKDPQSKKEKDKLDNDRRTNKFREKYGRLYATELDALPVYIENEFKKMVVESVNQYFDQDIYNHELEAHKEKHSQNTIIKLVKYKTKQFLRDFGQEDEQT